MIVSKIETKNKNMESEYILFSSFICSRDKVKIRFTRVISALFTSSTRTFTKSIKITLPKTKNLSGNLANILRTSRKVSVIYNTLRLSSADVGYPADVGHSLLKVVSPSINWSALGQTLFQRACFIGELFGKGLSRKEKISYRKEKKSNRNFYEKVSKFIKETSTALKFFYLGGDCVENS